MEGKDGKNCDRTQAVDFGAIAEPCREFHPDLPIGLRGA
jgi:hypothetical protein